MTDTEIYEGSARRVSPDVSVRGVAPQGEVT